MSARNSSIDMSFIHFRYVRNVEQCVFNLVWVGVRIFLDGMYFAFVDTVFLQGRTLVSSRNLRNRIFGMSARNSSIDISFIHFRYIRNVEQCVFNLVWVGVRIFLDGIYFAFVDTVFSQGRTLVSSRNLRNRICGMFARKHSQGMVEY